MNKAFVILITTTLSLFPSLSEAKAAQASPRRGNLGAQGNPATPVAAWDSTMLTSLKAIENSIESQVKKADGSIGVYMKHLRTGKQLSFRADEPWYIASGIKLPVALQVLRSIDEGTLHFNTKVDVLETDFIDGAGELNYIRQGSKVSVRFLLDQCLTFSDNTATDILIRLVGLEKVNALTASLVPGAFHPITTLAEVRRRVFSMIHPGAQNLSNMDLLRIRILKDDASRFGALAKLVKADRSTFRHQTMDSAFSAFYAERSNTATLRGFGTLLEKISQGTLLKERTRKHLLSLLERIETGENRIKAGLPSTYTFAHKTGTQHKRICDMGLLRNGTEDEVVIVACIRDLPKNDAEGLLRKIGTAIHESGVLAKETK